MKPVPALPLIAITATYITGLLVMRDCAKSFIVLFDSSLFESGCYWTICSNNYWSVIAIICISFRLYCRRREYILLVTNYIWEARRRDAQATWLVAIDTIPLIKSTSRKCLHKKHKFKQSNHNFTIAREREGGREGEWHCDIIWRENWAPLGIAINCKLYY